jgi:aminopeptidase YwaD
MRSRTSAIAVTIICMAASASRCDVPEISGRRSDWSGLWTPHIVDMTKPRQERVDRIGTLGTDLEGKDWLVISTKYNRIYYQPSIDAAKLRQVAGCIDNAYEFLKKWNPDAPETPIRTFLVPNELAHSSCCQRTNSMRTGDKGDLQRIVTSLLHEETHLFNHACLHKRTQGWWLGEFSCQYFQQRMKLEAAQQDVRQSVKSKLPDGPRCSLREIAPNAKERFDEAFSAMYFLHETFGDESLYKFRLECFKQTDQEPSSSLDSEGAFTIAFGKGFDELDRQWRRFYGWAADRQMAISGKSRNAKGSLPVRDLSPAELTAGIVSELAGPDYLGRAAGGPGEARASEYIADCFRHIGLAPILPNGDFVQRFPVVFRNLAGPVGLRIREREFVYKSDYGILRCSPGGWVEGSMYFVGFGEGNDKPPRQEMIKFRGNILVALARDADFSNAEAVIKLAADAEADAVLLIDPPSLYNAREISKRHTRLNQETPVLLLSPQTGEYVLSLDRTGLENLYKQHLAGKSPRLEIAGSCRLAAKAEYREKAESRNVLAGLKSANSAKKSILLFAHYDGQGQDGGRQYYPSANDNASGVAVMLAIAAKLDSRRADLQSNVFFAALGAEEIDCKGADRLLKSDAIDLNNVQLAICFDMVGHGNKDHLPVRTLQSNLPFCLALKEYAIGHGWDVEPSVREKLGSDAKVIMQKGTPTLYIITGGDKWHSVEDTSDNTDPKHMARIAELIAGFIAEFDSGRILPRSDQRGRQ